MKRPRTGASVCVVKDGKILLIKRGKEPHKGCWSLPGGGQELGESLEDCARRELYEETNLAAGTLSFYRVHDRISRDDEGAVKFHFVLATFFTSQVTGKAKARDDALEIGWYSLKEIYELETTPGTPGFLSQLVQENVI